MPRKNTENLKGQTFGRLVALSKVQKRSTDKNIFWECKCSCGEPKIVAASNLRNGTTNSCGCFRRELMAAKNITHGKSRTPEYITWTGMIDRCHNTENIGFTDYGGIGIKVCREWRDSFETFLSDMGPRPALRYSIDRKDNNLGYFKENCRWATNHTQSRNRSDNKFITIDGVTLCQSDWCKKLGIEYSNTYRKARRSAYGSVEAVIRDAYQMFVTG